MRRKIGALAVLGAAAIPLSLAANSQAADHLDSPAATADPMADITDLYAWMNEDADKLNLVLNVGTGSSEGSAFSSAVQYAIHIHSAPAFGEPASETVVLCQFYDPDALECWLGDTYVEGDASDAQGIESDDGKLKVFAGLRNDPFFMEFEGFTETVKTVVGAADSLTFDEAGCPDVPSDVQTALVTQLQSGMDGAPASDTFAGSNVMSIALEVDKSLVTSGGPVLGLWASTHAAK